MKVVISFETDIPQLGLYFIKSLPEDEKNGDSFEIFIKHEAKV